LAWSTEETSICDNSGNGSYKKVHSALGGFIGLGLMPCGCASGPCIIGKFYNGQEFFWSICVLDCDWEKYEART
jgi:hypothetical protein